MWHVETTDVFDQWFDALDATDRTNVLAMLLVADREFTKHLKRINKE